MSHSSVNADSLCVSAHEQSWTYDAILTTVDDRASSISNWSVSRKIEIDERQLQAKFFISNNNNKQFNLTNWTILQFPGEIDCLFLIESWSQLSDLKENRTLVMTESLNINEFAVSWGLRDDDFIKMNFIAVLSTYEWVCFWVSYRSVLLCWVSFRWIFVFRKLWPRSGKLVGAK